MFCRLQMLSIWTSLNFCRLVEIKEKVIKAVSHPYYTHPHPTLKKGEMYKINVLPFCLSVTNIFLGNCSSHQVETWYGTSTQGPTHLLRNSGSPALLYIRSQYFFSHIFVGNYSSHQLETWYGTSKRVSISPLQCLNSCPPVIYFLFPDLGIAGFYSIETHRFLVVYQKIMTFIS